MALGYMYPGAGIPYVECDAAFQGLADEWTLIAQRFVGYWHGYPVQGLQLSPVTLIGDQAWVEPMDESDDCSFCTATSPERVEARILGYQHALDKEFIRINSVAVSQAADVWRYEKKHGAREKDFGETRIEALAHDNYNDYRILVTWVERNCKDEDIEAHSYEFVDLPYYLKFRLCVLWNHALNRWLGAHPEFMYDTVAHEIHLREHITADEDDIKFAATPMQVDDLTLSEQIVQEYENGLF